MEQNGLGQVRRGMTVVDTEGTEVGKVELLQAADPDATTPPEPEPRAGEAGAPMTTPPTMPGAAPGGVMGSIPGSGGLLNAGAAPPPAVEEPYVPPTEAERLRRLGYLKVDSKGIFARDVYVSADQIHDVTGDVVTLSVAKADLEKEN